MIQKIKMAHPEYTVSELCRVFELSLSSYYYQIKDKPMSQEKQEIVKLLKQTAQDTHNSYGKRRMQEELQNEGHCIGIYKTSSLMKEFKIKAIRPKKKHHYPNGGVSDVKVENVLNRVFDQPHANTHWVTDITYIRNHQCWSYLAAVLDLGSKEIVGLALSKKPDTALAKAAIEDAINRKNPNTTKLLIHSDQGTQYTSNMFDKYCKNLKIIRSMSRRGNCWDNAVIERFFRNLKTERLNQLTFINHEAVSAEVESYIYFYNYKRLNSAIDYKVPHQKFIELSKVA